MRNCPVCYSTKRRTDWRSDFLVPDGWTLPAYLDWYYCLDCGMIYGDHPDAKQADYDRFYIERYGYDSMGEQAKMRNIRLAEWAMKSCTSNETCIVDFGGGKGGLTEYLQAHGYRNAHNIGPNQNLPRGRVDLLFASHVLEHIYDLTAAMIKIANCVTPGGLLVVDGPAAEWYAAELPYPMLDYHQQHINHFAFENYIHMMYRYGFTYLNHRKYEETGPAYSMVFTRTMPEFVYNASMAHCVKQEGRDLINLRNLGDKPVIVWGCGDRAMHLLSQHMPNVQYFVDKNPTYKGAIINGLKVQDTVTTDDTILVIAQRQAQAILDNIKAEGLTNEVVVI